MTHSCLEIVIQVVAWEAVEFTFTLLDSIIFGSNLAILESALLLLLLIVNIITKPEPELHLFVFVGHQTNYLSSAANSDYFILLQVVY